MQVQAYNPNYGVTKNGNPYKKSDMGKRIGRDLGLGYVAFSAAKTIYSGRLSAGFTQSVTSLSKNFNGRFVKFITKYPALSKWAGFGVAAAVAAVVAGGIGKLAGHCVDKIVEAKRKKAADRAAEA